jgi:hypothetical protein
VFAVQTVRNQQLLVCNLHVKLLYLRIYLSNYLCRILLPNYNPCRILLLNYSPLKPQLQSYLRLNLQASYLQTNGVGYKTLIELWRLYS